MVRGERRPVRPGAGPVAVEGTVRPSDAKTYELVPFEVLPGTTRIEVSYTWSPVAGTTIDLGLRDAAGPFTTAGFRGWSGSRHGRRHEGQPAVHVQADTAERTYAPGPVEPGTWHVELGIAEVAPEGATWRVEIEAFDATVGPTPRPDPVDATHVARRDAGWYHGDLHLHGYHSHPEGPEPEEMVGFARAAGLDFVPVTEYVVGRHWDELGATQRAHPDLVIWPGREVITYWGHAIVLGETPSTLEYRHGFEGISLADVQRASVDDGALFGIAHPTIYPEADWGSFCRGCEFQLTDDIDLDRVHTVEVVTGPAAPGGHENPFVGTAIAYWHDLLRRGHKITAVSGSDDKLGSRYGQTATAIHARQLSRARLAEALRAGHAYVRALGVEHSPRLGLTAHAGGATASFGDSLAAERVEVELRVEGGRGQLLRVLCDGDEVDLVPVRTDDWTHRFVADRRATSGPLGTFWGFETVGGVSRTAIANPVFLTG